MISILSYAGMEEHVVLNNLSTESGLWRACESGSLRIVRKDSILHAKVNLSCSQMSASKLSSASMSLWVVPRFPYAIAPLLIISAIA